MDGDQVISPSFRRIKKPVKNSPRLDFKSVGRTLTSSTTSPQRTGDSTGVNKLLTATERKNAENQIVILQNRINKLYKNDVKFRTKIDEMLKKQEEQEKKKQRNAKKKEEKLSIVKQSAVEEKKKRHQFAEVRKQHRRNLKQLQEEIHKKKIEINKETREQSKVHDKLQKEAKIKDREEKAVRAREIKNYQESVLKKRAFTQLEYLNDLKSDYNLRADKEKKKLEKATSKLKKLEDLETDLINKLSETKNMHQETLKKLGDNSEVERLQKFLETG